MHILEQRFLRGPNVHAATPCLLSVVDLGDLYGVSTRDIPHFNDALLALLPSLADYLVPTGQPGGFAQRLREGTYLARVVEHVTLGLQCLAGAPVGFGRTRPVSGKPGQYRIVCAYQIEKVAQPAFALAVDIVDALAHGRPFELEPRLTELRDLAGHYAIGTSTAAVLVPIAYCSARSRSSCMRDSSSNGSPWASASTMSTASANAGCATFSRW